MIPLIKLKKDVEFNEELTYVIDALKGIALARFHVLQRRLNLFEEFSKAAGDMLALVDLKTVSHPFLNPRSNRTAVIIITSDQGFLGGLNSNVMNAGLAEAGDDPLVTVIGERGANNLRDLRKEFKDFPGITDKKDSSLPFEVRDHVLGQVMGGECGKIIVAYPKPVSLAIQKITVETFLPCQEWVSKMTKPQDSSNYIWESAPGDVLSYIVTQWMGHRLREIFALSRISELAARVMHLENSYQELLKLGKKLSLQYFRSKHEVIDRSMREVFATQLLFGNLEREKALKLLQDGKLD